MVRTKGGVVASSQGLEAAGEEFLTGHDYDIEWPIKASEVDRYNDLKDLHVTGNRFIRKNVLKVEIGVWKKFKKLLKRVGLRHFFNQKYPAYEELTLEFYTTVRRDDSLNFSLHCRLNGHPVEIYPQVIREIFEMDRSQVTSFPLNTKINDIWKSIGGGVDWKSSGGVKSALIKKGLHCIFHKFLAHSVFGKMESNKISQNELLVLWSAINKKQVDVATLLFNKLDECARGVSRMNLVLGHVITAIAVKKDCVHLGDLARFTASEGPDIDVGSLRAAHIISMDDPKKFVPWQDRPAYKTLARMHGIDFGSSSGVRDEQNEEAFPHGVLPQADVPMPDVPIHSPTGQSRANYSPTGMGTEQLDRVHERFDGICTQLQRIEDNQQQYYAMIEARMQQMEHKQQQFFSQFSYAPQPPPM